MLWLFLHQHSLLITRYQLHRYIDKDKTTLEQDVVISGTTQITAATINAKDKDLNVTLGGHDITATSTVDQGFVEGVKLAVTKML